MGWARELAAKLSNHSDSVAVVRAGKGAKRRTRRRERHLAAQELKKTDQQK